MRLFWILTIVAFAAIASAQGDFLRRPSPFAGRTMLTLALFEEVRTELKTTSDVNSKIDGLVDKLQAELQDTFQGANGDFDAIRPAIDKINAKYDDECAKILTADQNSRLKQLFIQYNGAMAIMNPAVSTDLAITEDQKTKIKAAQDDNNKKMRDAFANGGGQDEAQQTFAKLQDDLKATLDKILTDDQRAKFKTMQGAKFEFKKVTVDSGSMYPKYRRRSVSLFLHATTAG
jgi:hypothetical protein